MSFDSHPLYKAAADHLQMRNRKDSMSEVSQALHRGQPVIVGRISQGENNFVRFYEEHRQSKDIATWPERLRNSASAVGGIVPPTDEMLDEFCRIYIKFLHSCDLISFAPHGDPEVLNWNTHIITTYCPNALCYSYGHVFEYPFMSRQYHDHAAHWIRSLDGKTVLVVSPFEDSIRAQCSKLEEVYSKYPEECPRWKAVKVAKAPLSQTVYDESSGLPATNWLQQVESLNSLILASGNFDVALVGCGPYTFPACTFIKEVCKKPAVMVGGVLQVLFGITGERFVRRDGIAKAITSAWVRPLESERPENYKTIEGSCYW